ncbi:MAG: large conductance mechanosensitive channel [Saprospiraceae bacterium]|jgi:large conductance mechanosensitive channel
MKKVLTEFKEFAIKGNMIDIAIGVIMGAAFNKVVDVLVKQVFLPPLSFLTNGTNWENKKFILRDAVETDGGITFEEIAIGYGKLIEVSVDFLIISFTVFMVIKFINRLRNKAEDVKDKTVKTPKDIELLAHIKELLAHQNELLKKG